MAMVGEQFLVGDELCGIVLSLRNPWDQVFLHQSHQEFNRLDSFLSGTEMLQTKLQSRRFRTRLEEF